jgi:predicted ATPase
METFFGRAAELASLRDAAAEAFLDGHVTVALIEGDPGSGKSRLLAEFLPELAESSTLSVACYQPEARLPLSLAWTLSDATPRSKTSSKK